MWIDVHSHILPCDHGSQSVEMSLKQLQYAKKYNITTIIATPHFDHRKESVASFLQRRAEAYEALVSHPQFPKDITIELAAEVSVEHGLETCPDLEQLTIAGGKYMLLEFSKFEHGDWAFDTLYDIKARGIVPIIAHIHRYSDNTVDQILNTDFYCQFNAITVTKRDSWQRVKNWILSHQVHFLGSDIHGDTEEDYRNFKRVCKKIPKNELERLMNNAQLLLQQT